jgi:ComF family protein
MFNAPPIDVNRNGRMWLTAPWALGRHLATAAMWELAPPRCLLCEAAGDVGAIDICRHCLAQLPRNSSAWQPGMGAIARICCPWRYDYPVDALIRSLKFRGERACARLLGGLLAEQLRGDDGSQARVVVPMPLHQRRLQQRGYNQALEIAVFAARPLALPVRRDALARQRATLAQSTLSLAERRLNPRGAFKAGEQLRGAHVALVDDVITTGSTAAAAAEALLAAGVASVELWVLARVQRAAASQMMPSNTAMPK